MSPRRTSDGNAVPKQSVDLIGKADEVFGLLLSTPSLTVAQIADGVGLPRPSVYRLLATLEQLELVRPTAAGNRYQLGLRLFELGLLAQTRNLMVQQTTAAMEELNQYSGETVFLQSRKGDHAICLARVDGARTTLLVLEEGGSLPLHVGAGPRMLLASLDDDEVERYIERAVTSVEPPYTLTDVASLRTLIARTRRDGFSLSDGDVVPGIATIATPLVDRRGDVVGTIAVGGARDAVIGNDPERLARVMLGVTQGLDL